MKSPDPGTLSLSDRTAGIIAGVIVLAAALLVLNGAGIAAPRHARRIKTAAVVTAAPKIPASSDLYWQRARLEIYKSAEQLKAQNKAELSRGFRFPKLMHGNPRLRQVAITFDDGPHPGYTLRILEILQKYHVKATFFLVGEQAERFPYLVRAEAAAGDCLGNHTYHHVNLTKIPFEAVATEVRACGDIIRDITGKSPHFFRPPGGDYDREVAKAVCALGYTTVLWTDDPGDYAMPAPDILKARILNHIRPGAIILLHDGIQQTIDILPDVLTFLKDRGYQLVTIQQMAAEVSKRASARRRGGRS